MSDLVIKDGGVYKYADGYIILYRNTLCISGYYEGVDADSLEYICHINDLDRVERSYASGYDEKFVLILNFEEINYIGTYVIKGAKFLKDKIKKRLLWEISRVKRNAGYVNRELEDLENQLSELEN